MSRTSNEQLSHLIIVAISPILIMLLVGSLGYFLIEAFYHGMYPGRLRYSVSLFVLAAVLVTRIAIEQGAAYAQLFAIPLAIVTFIVVSTFVDAGLLFNILIIAALWWSAHKLTWDCTVLDRAKDLGGEGLLQTAGLDPDGVATTIRKSDEATRSKATIEGGGKNGGWWEFVKPKQPRAHGVWVIYFCLASLPLFGVGQLFIHSGDTDSRRAVFRTLVVYVGSALLLLMTTSFLQMRRYLLQRKLDMSPTMASVWMMAGASMVTALLLGCMVLPRPNPEYSMTDWMLPDGGTSQLESSRYGWGNEGVWSDTSDDSDTSHASDKSDDSKLHRDEQGSGSSGGERSAGTTQEGDAEAAQRTNSAESQSSETASSDSNNATRESTTSRSPPGQPSDSGDGSDPREDGNEKSGARSRGSDHRESPSARRGPSLLRRLQDAEQSLASILQFVIKLLYWVVVLAGVAYLLFRYRNSVRAALRQFWFDLRKIWERFWGRQQRQEEAETQGAGEPLIPPSFASFVDPFQAGQAERMPKQELLAYTFAAMVAWARERDCVHKSEQTPLEFANSLGTVEPVMGDAAARFASVYTHLAYAGGTYPARTLDVTRALWQVMSQVNV